LFLSLACTKRGCTNGPKQRSEADVLAEVKAKLLEWSGLPDAVFSLKVFDFGAGLWRVGIVGHDDTKVVDALEKNGKRKLALALGDAAIAELFGEPANE
jgi:hypothetical protein